MLQALALVGAVAFTAGLLAAWPIVLTIGAVALLAAAFVAVRC